MKPKKLGAIVFGTIIMVIVMTTMDRLERKNSNPMIGKWRGETVFPNVGNVVNEIEFTKESVSMEGITFKVNYEVEEKRVIVNDEKGIGTIYTIISPSTMESYSMGIKTVYTRI